MLETKQYTNQKTGRKLFVLVGSAIGFFLFTSLVLSVCLLFQGMASGGNLNALSRYSTVLKIIQLITTVTTFLVPVLILARISGMKSKTFLSADRGSSVMVFMCTIAMIIAIQPFMNATSVWFSHWSLPSSLSWLEHWLKNMEQRNADLVTVFLNVNSVGGLLFNVLVVAVAPAICEEFFFRGGLQRLLCEKMNQHAAVWLTAVVFSAVHLEVSGFLPRVVLGASFGYLLIWTGTIWIPVAAHFVNNLFGVLTGYLIYNHLIEKKIENFGTGESFWGACLGLILFVVCLWTIFRKTQRPGDRY